MNRHAVGSVWQSRYRLGQAIWKGVDDLTEPNWLHKDWSWSVEPTLGVHSLMQMRWLGTWGMVTEKTDVTSLPIHHNVMGNQYIPPYPLPKKHERGPPNISILGGAQLDDNSEHFLKWHQNWISRCWVQFRARKTDRHTWHTDGNPRSGDSSQNLCQTINMNKDSFYLPHQQ